MDPTLDTLTVVISAVSATVATATALAALTKGARLRRQSAIIRDELAAATGTYDRAVLQSLHREVTAQMIALMAVPAWRMGQLLVLYLLGLPAALLAGVGIGMASRPLVGGGAQANQYHLEELVLVVGLTMVSLMMLLFGMAWFLKAQLERSRIKRLYLDGRDLDRKLFLTPGLIPSAERPSWAVHDRDPPKSRLRRRMWWTVTSTSLLPWLLMLSVGLFIARPDAEGADAAIARSMAATVLIVLVALPTAKDSVQYKHVLSPTVDDWVHPRPPSPTNQIQAEIASARRAGPPHRCRRRWMSWRRRR